MLERVSGTKHDCHGVSQEDHCKKKWRDMQTVDEQYMTQTDSPLRSVDKLKLAARLVEEVAYAQAGFQSQQKVAHLMLVAASLDRLAQSPSDFADANAWPALVKR